MANKVITTAARSNAARAWIAAVRGEDTLYYVFAANHRPADDELNIEPISETDEAIVTTYNDMIFGKEITNGDVEVVTRKVEWVSGEAYDAYDDKADITTLNYYVSVNDGGNRNVYKCLSNGGGANSTVAPAGIDTDPIESPLDGYIWQYLYTIEEDDWNKFSSALYMPVFPNANVVAAAEDRKQSINIINVEDGGAGYDNYVTGAFRLSDLRIGNDITYGIKDDANPIEDFYAGCIIKMITGPAAGQYRTIDSYGIVSSRKQITLESAFSSPPGATDEYEIYPAITITTPAAGAERAVARALIDTSGNTVGSVEILDPGAFHRTATANVYFHPSVNVIRQAELTPVVSPIYGHGGNIYDELNAKFACISVKFEPDDTVLPATNTFRTIGVIKAPTFNNVKVNFDQSQAAAFVSSEEVVQFESLATLGDVSVSGNVVTGTSTLFVSQLNAGDRVLVANNTHTDMVTISQVSNNTSATAQTAITAISGTGSRVGITANGVSDIVTSSSVILFDVHNKFKEGALLFGMNSKGTGVIKTSNATFNAITINDRDANDFGAFIQATTFNADLTAGTLVEDEILLQESPDVFGVDATAHIHSIDTTDEIIYVTNVSNAFELNSTAIGNTSSAQATLLAKYNGDLTVDSGEILYAENVLSISRVDNKSETVKLIFEF